jgi:hypothetical protein
MSPKRPRRGWAGFAGRGEGWGWGGWGGKIAFEYTGRESFMHLPVHQAVQSIKYLHNI